MELIAIVRHCACERDLLKVNPPLTAAGWQQADENGQRLKKEGFFNPTIFSSTALRCLQTAEALTARLGGVIIETSTLRVSAFGGDQILPYKLVATCLQPTSPALIVVTHHQLVNPEMMMAILGQSHEPTSQHERVREGGMILYINGVMMQV